MQKGQGMKQDEKKKIKNYLRGYERAEERIRQIEADIDYINQTLDSMPQIFDGMPRGGNMSDRAAQEGQRLWALSMELSEKRCEAIKKRKEIAEKIRQVPNAKYMRLLYSRYIELKPWAEIALDMNRDPRWVFRIHNFALEAIKDILTI